jgi:putative endonuclease
MNKSNFNKSENPIQNPPRLEPNETNPEINPDKEQLNLGSFHYVYILKSESHDNTHYTGLTHNLKARLQKHNTGQVPHTSKYRPWRIETAIAFRSREKAAAFERYLKSHSGRAFAAKRL